MSDQASIAQQLKELEQLTQEFESGQIDLEQAIVKFKQGVSLAKSLKAKLKDMQNQIKEINLDLERNDDISNSASEN